TIERRSPPRAIPCSPTASARPGLRPVAAPRPNGRERSLRAVVVIDRAHRPIGAWPMALHAGGPRGVRFESDRSHAWRSPMKRFLPIMLALSFSVIAVALTLFVVRPRIQSIRITTGGLRDK